MSLSLGLALYFIVWWLIWFAVLPFAARGGEGAGEGAGQDGIPATPNLWRLAAIATAVSVPLFALIYVIIVYRLLPVDKLPF